MSNGGAIAQRGFIFQSIIAMIECLERNDWDEIKMEPETELDKVDFELRRNGLILSAFQVKSSINPFERSDVEKWLRDIKLDAAEADEVYLYLVGDSFAPSCDNFITGHSNEVKKVPFKNLQDLCMGKLVQYIKSNCARGDVRVDDLEIINDSLLAKIFKNSIAEKPISHVAFEERFQKSLPVHMIPKCLTPIPTINYECGLIGRDDVKKVVRKKLEENDRTVLVSGLGGIGKTALMRHTCNDIKNKGYYVAWIDCSDSFREDLLLLRNTLGIPRSDNSEQALEKILDTIRSRLNDKLYLFMDNLSYTLDKTERSILNSLGIHVMVTSRFKHSYFASLELDVLDRDSAANMFFRYYVPNDSYQMEEKKRRYKETAYTIIDSVNRHTLLVELIAKAAWKKGGTLDAFRNELETADIFNVFRGRVSSDHTEGNLTIEESVIGLYKLSNLTLTQKHIMELFTVFTPDREIYYKIVEWADLKPDAIDELVKLRWLERGGLENGYQIHQIVKDSLKKQVGTVVLTGYGNLLNNVANTNRYMPVNETYEFVRERITLTEDIAKYLWRAYQSSSEKDESLVYKTWLLLNNLALVYEAQGNYDKALKSFEKACAICEQMFGFEHPDTAGTYDNLARVYGTLADYEKALEYFEKACAIRERVLGTQHLDTAATYNNLGLLYHNLGDYRKAREYFEKARAIHERVLGTKHPDTAATYNSLGVLYLTLGDYRKALEYFEKALAIYENEFGTRHPGTAAAYNNLAEVYQKLGNYVRALEHYRIVLSIREHLSGPEHPDMASTYDNLAIVYTDLSDYRKAQEYFEKALAIRKRALGTKHPDTAATYSNLAKVYQKLGDYQKALEYFEKTRVIYERVLGTEHLDTAASYNNLAVMSLTQGDYVKALEYFEKTLAIREQILDCKHPDMANTYYNLSVVYQKQGNYKMAFEYSKKALTVQVQVFGTEHPDTARTYHILAELYIAKSDYVKALEYFKKAGAIRERVLGTEHPDTAATYDSLAGVYHLLGDLEKALEYFERALAIRERVSGTNHPDTAVTYSNLAKVYHSQKDYVKALEYFKKALAIYERVSGTEHPDTAAMYSNLAVAYLELGNYETALAYYVKALAIHERAFGKEHPSTAAIYSGLAKIYQKQGAFEKALMYYTKALNIRERFLDAKHLDTAVSYHDLAMLYQEQGDYEKALEYYKKALILFSSIMGENHAYTLNTQRSIEQMEFLVLMELLLKKSK